MDKLFSRAFEAWPPKNYLYLLRSPASDRIPSEAKRREGDRENGGICELNSEVASVAAPVAAMATATQAILLAQGVPTAVIGASSSSSKLTQLAPSSSSSSLYGSLAGLRAQQASVRGVSSSSSATRAAAVSLEAPVPKQQRKSQYDITTFTTWLLKQEQAGVIDGELTIVLSSISLACKQIASLVQRAGISNMTGLQGASNVQGEDQKKLDVISNEVRISQLIPLFLQAEWRNLNLGHRVQSREFVAEFEYEPQG